MKRNYSMPKMNLIEVSNRLNRLKAKNKPRLQFPNKIQSKKHYFDYQADHIVLGQDNQQLPVIKQIKRNNLDISDIQGARPKVIQKQKNVMNYYHNIHQQYNPFAPFGSRISRTISQPKLTPNNHLKTQQTDSLDLFQRQMQKKLVINPQKNHRTPLNYYQNKRQITQPNGAFYENDILLKKLPTQIRSPTMNNNNNNLLYRPQNSKFQRKSLVFNPTFLSNLVLL